jgi:hypothetical protein
MPPERQPDLSDSLARIARALESIALLLAAQSDRDPDRQDSTRRDYREVRLDRLAPGLQRAIREARGD